MWREAKHDRRKNAPRKTLERNTEEEAERTVGVLSCKDVYYERTKNKQENLGER